MSSREEEFTDKKPAGKKSKAWTVMVYMAAAKNEQTELAAIEDLKELQSVDTGDEVNVVVQIDRAWPGYPQRYCIEQGRSEPHPDKRLSRTKDMSTGEPEPLRQFLHWTRRHKPADRYMLVLWGHAFGLGFGRDHGNALTMPELASALTSCGERWVDVLGVNACAMSYAEAAYELRKAAKFLVAPEITMPLPGWPYGDILTKLVAEGRKIATKELGKQIVDSYVDSFGGKDVSLTLLDLSKAEYLQKTIESLAEKLTEASENGLTKGQVANAFLDTAYGDVRPLIDLDDLCENLAGVKKADVKAAAATMRELLVPEGDGLIAHHRADPALEGLHGLGIFALSVTGAADLTRLELSERNYRALALMQDTNYVWAELVYDKLKTLLDAPNKAVAALVKGQGATTSEDRSGVAQLLVSINRAFTRFDETYSDVKESVRAAMRQPAPDPAKQPPDPAGQPPDPAEQPPQARAGIVYASDGHSNGNGNGNGNHHLRLLHRRPYGDPASAWPPAQAPAIQPKIGNGHDSAAARRRDAVTGSLRRLEDALEKAEKTTRRVVTHARLGLGETSSKPGGLGDGQDPFKTGFGQDPFKTGFGSDPFKTGFGQDPFKTGFGLLPWLFVRDDVESGTSDGRTLTQLYGQIARSLFELEDALEKLETAALLTGAFDPAATESDRQGAQEEVERSFRELEDALANAKETASWILLHPTYGLGAGREPGLHPMVRQQLAIAGGLSPRSLRLL